MDKLIQKYKPILFPLVVTVVMVVASLFTLNFLFSRINSVRSQTSNVQAENEVLSERLSTLQSFSDQMRTAVNVASLAIPDKNPSILVTSQLRSIANRVGVGVSRLDVTRGYVDPNAESAISQYDISFELFGENYEKVSQFVQELSTITPLVNLTSITINSEATGLTATVRLTAYSAPFPLELPALDEPLSGLSASEQETLSLLEGFSGPSLNTSGSAAGAAEILPRDNPFTIGN